MRIPEQATATVPVDLTDLRIAGAVMLAAGLALPAISDGAGLPCPLRTLTGVPCPLCGMTTSVIATLHLDLGDAFAANPLGIVAVLVAIALLAFRPKRLTIPALLPAVLLVPAWAFELHRFSFL